MGPKSQPQLLDSAKHLDWLPDETVYSLASRHHTLSGNIRPDRTSLQLFGHARGGYPHDLPAGLDHLAASFDGRLGDARRIALEHTILSAFLVARPAVDWNTALSAMRSPRLGSLKAQFGLLASGFGAICDLKACSICMAADTAKYGTPYWHVEHQVPGVWICNAHQEWLLVSIASRARQGRFDWRLPEASDLTLPPGLAGDLGDKQLTAIHRLSQLSLEAASMADRSILAGDNVGDALRRGMGRAGWISKSGRLATSAIATELKSTISALSALPDWAADSASEATCVSRVRDVLNAPGQGHPLKLLVVTSCLFDSWSDFLADLEVQGTEIEGKKQSEEKDQELSDTRAEFLEAANGVGSVTALARKFNIAIRTAQSWLAAEGRTTPKRPSKISGSVLLRLTEGLAAGNDPSALAEETKLSESSVRRVLGTTVGLKDKWVAAQQHAVRTEIRERWVFALSVVSPGGPKITRGIDPGAYAWLYRNDREWLIQSNARQQQPRSGNNRRLDWGARDLALSDACRIAANDLIERDHRARITLMDLFRVVPELRTKLCKIDRLPLTLSVIQAALQASAQQLPLGLALADE
jgi:hypothetical protein